MDETSSNVPEKYNTSRPTDLEVSNDIPELSTMFNAFKQRVLPLPPQ